jgi:signal transduction histidine kinase
LNQDSRVWWLAWSVFTVCVVLYASTFCLNLAHSGELYAPLVFAFLVTPGVGAIVASRQPGNAIGWLLLATGLGLGIVAAGSEYAAVSETESLPLGPEIGALSNMVFVGVVVTGAVLVPLLFPDGRLPTPRWRFALHLAAAALPLGTIGYAVKPGTLGLDGVTSDNPFGIDGMEWVLDIGLALLVAAALTAAISLVIRFRRSRGEERQQLKWFAFAAVLMLMTLSVVGIAEAFNRSLFAVELVAWILLFFALPTSIGIAVLRYHLWDVDVVMRRSLVYGTLWLTIAGVYFGAALMFGLAASERMPVWLAVGLTVLATLVFQPSRHWLETAADRWVFGRRLQPLKVVHSFGELLGSAERAGDIARQLTQAATAAAPLTWIRVETSGSGVAEFGYRREDPVVSLPLVYGDERLGEILCQLLPGSGLSDDERSTLAALAAQAAVAISRAQLASRIVRAQETERRRIERNIHDGAQQELVALVAKLGLARRQNGNLDHGQFLTELQNEVRTILGNLRELAQGVHPSVLADGGLAAAIEDRCSHLPIPVSLQIAPDLRGRRFDDDIEAAAYFMVAEGLTNLLRHSGARSASVLLDQHGGAITATVTDDGSGFEPEGASTGGGLQGLADRIQAIGGSLSIESSPGAGTKLSASLPIPTAATT